MALYSGFRTVCEDGGTLQSGHAISFILTCMQTQTSHDILQFSFSVSPLPLGSLLTDILCRGTLETEILLACRAAGREEHSMSTEGPAWPMPGPTLLIHIVELVCNVNISKRNVPLSPICTYLPRWCRVEFLCTFFG